MELTLRQTKLLDLLLSEPNKWFSQKEITEKISGYEYVERNNDRCATIRKDKIDINDNPKVEHIIVMKNYKFKIGTKEEVLEERKKHIARGKRQFEECKAIDFKLRRNNHGKLDDTISTYDATDLDYYISLLEEENNE